LIRIKSLPIKWGLTQPLLVACSSALRAAETLVGPRPDGATELTSATGFIVDSGDIITARRAVVSWPQRFELA
jgi:hypothetical protein